MNTVGNIGDSNVVKALVVDDSTVMRKIIMRQLVAAGVDDIDEATDGEQALEAISMHDYSVVMMDWNMPNMTGIDAVRAIREQGNMVPIIMVTTESERSRILEAIKTGVNDYIMKPFSEVELVETVKNVLARWLAMQS